MKTSNRASAKAGRKSPSKQSGITTKTPSAETQKPSVFVQFIDVDGTIIPDLELPAAVYESLRPHIQSHLASRLTRSPNSTDTHLFPIHERGDKSVSATIQLSPGDCNSLDALAQRNVTSRSDAFCLALARGLRLSDTSMPLFPGSTIEDTISLSSGILDLLADKLIVHATDDVTCGEKYKAINNRQMLGQLEFIRQAKNAMVQLHSEATTFGKAWLDITMNRRADKKAAG